MKRRIKLIVLASCVSVIILSFAKRQSMSLYDQDKAARSDRQTSARRFTAPEGFEVENVARGEDTGSIINMTFDGRGRPVIARERSGIFILEDRDGDGRYETLKPYSEKVKNCQGLCFIGNDLLAVAHEGPKGPGLYHLVDRNGDGRADDVRLILKIGGRMGEHGPHAIIVGPDGYFYLAVGNHAYIQGDPDPLSPHRGYNEGQLLPSWYDPRGHARGIMAPGGTVVRIDPDLKKKRWWMIAGGFRNHYDIAFNLLGELFTFDSDMEWDIGLPWYRPVRVVHVVPGGEYGWRTGSGKWPDYFIDSLPPLIEVGRGSPVGVDFYHHHTYPAKYYDAFFMGDWSRGRILVCYLKRSGATYTGTVEEFITGRPINVTDLEVGPDGNLYFSLGGRGTEGGLYRVVYRGAEAVGRRKTKPDDATSLSVEAALAQPQPFSAWGRARLAQMRRRLGRRWGEGLLDVARDSNNDVAKRVRALYLLQVFGPAPSERLLIDLTSDSKAEVRAAAAFLLGLDGSQRARQTLVRMLKDSDPLVQRRACESLVRAGLNPATPSQPIAELLALLNDADRWLRYAARIALQRTRRELWYDRVIRETSPRAAVEGLLALILTHKNASELEGILRKEVELLRSGLDAEGLLGLLRVIQLTFINGKPIQHDLQHRIGELLLKRFPSNDWRIDRELARLLAYLQVPGAIEKILAKMPEDDSQKEQQIHYIYCLRVIKEGWTAEQKNKLLAWFDKAQQWRGGASFRGYIENLWNAALALLTPEERELELAKRAEQMARAQAQANDEIEKVRGRKITRLSNQELIEYLEFDPMSYYKGSAQRGERIFERARCARCHRFNDVGEGAGPDLTDVARRFNRRDIIEAILYPSKDISDQYEGIALALRDGRIVTGLPAYEDDQKIILLQMDATKVEIPKSAIRRRSKATTSIMPEGLLDDLSVDEIIDLLAYLESGAK